MKSYYYYAGGKQVGLRKSTDLVAVDDLKIASVPQLLALKDMGDMLNHGVRLLNSSEVPVHMLLLVYYDHLNFDVYRSEDNTVLILLPELRIEKYKKLQAIETYLAGKVTKLSDDPYTVGVNRTGDTLSLANELVERFPPVSVTPRFIRITDPTEVDIEL